jgi:lysophospholipase L1-like esterase
MLRNKRAGKVITKYFPNVALLIAALIFSLAIGEIIARINYKSSHVVFELHGIHRVSPSPNVIYELQPDAHLEFPYAEQGKTIHYRVNSLGVRGAEPTPYDPNKRTIRIVILGDSVSFGVRVDQEDIYSERLRKKLNAWALENNLDLQFEIYNPSACGWNTFNQVSWLEHYGPQIQPDVVFVQFCMNDVDDPRTQMGTTVLWHMKNPIPRDLFPFDPGEDTDFIHTRTEKDITFAEVIDWYGPKASKLFFYARNAWRQMIHTWTVEEGNIKPSGPSRPYYAEFSDQLADELSEQSQWLKGQYGRLRTLAEDLNTTVTVIVSPMSYQLHPNEEVFADALNNVLRYANESNLNAIDLRPTLAPASKDFQFNYYLHWPPDAKTMKEVQGADSAHLNEAGHQAVAEILMKYLSNHLLSNP